MADYLTTDTELTSVANAIRTKGGTSAQLVYPTGFVSAIEAIPTGGGGGYEDITSQVTLSRALSQYEQVQVLSNGNDGIVLVGHEYNDPELVVTLPYYIKPSREVKRGNHQGSGIVNFFGIWTNTLTYNLYTMAGTIVTQVYFDGVSNVPIFMGSNYADFLCVVVGSDDPNYFDLPAGVQVTIEFIDNFELEYIINEYGVAYIGVYSSDYETVYDYLDLAAEFGSYIEQGDTWSFTMPSADIVLEAVPDQPD